MKPMTERTEAAIKALELIFNEMDYDCEDPELLYNTITIITPFVPENIKKVIEWYL